MAGFVAVAASFRPAVVTMPLPGVDGDAQKGQKVDGDFIVLSEFSEQVGPIPIQVLPHDGAGTFDTSHFSVRIMSTDFQGTTEKFSMTEDTQVLLSEKQDNIYAYVHYFCLNDIHARGYVRQFCISYLTSSFIKLTDNFEELLQHFKEVTTLFKCGNYRVFGKDLEHHLADLEHTMELLDREALPVIAEDGEHDSNRLYEGFDFGSENVPERDPTVVKHAIEETKNIMDTLKEAMTQDYNQKMQVYIERQKRSFQRLQQFRSPPSSESPYMRREGNFVSYMPMESSDFGISQSVFSMSSELSSSLEVSHYEPQRVMAHIVHKFERRLRSLEELSSRGYPAAMDKLQKIHRIFSRSELALAMEREENLFLEPRSSLLSIGRVPQLNVLQDFRMHISQPSPLLLPQPYRLSCRNTWGQPLQFSSPVPEFDMEDEMCSGFDTSFLEDPNVMFRWPLYMDVTTDVRRRSTIVSDTMRFDEPTDEPDTDDITIATLSLDALEDDRASSASNTFHTPESGHTPPPHSSTEDVELGAGERFPPSGSSAEEEGEGVSFPPSGPEDGGKEAVGFPADSDPNFDSIRVDQKSIQENQAMVNVPNGVPETVIVNGNGVCSTDGNGPSFVTDADIIGGMKDGFSINCDTEHPISLSQEKNTGRFGKMMEKGKETFRQLIGQQRSDSVEEDIAAGLGYLEISTEDTHSEAISNHPHLLRHGGPKPSNFYSQGDQNPKTGRVRTRQNGDGAAKRKVPPNLQLESEEEKGLSPEYHSPMSVPPGGSSLLTVGNTNSLANMGSPFSPISDRSVSSIIERTRFPPVVELRGHGKLPFVSSIDHIEGEYRFKPGRGILSVCKDNVNAKDLIYCLLRGRPLVIIGSSKDKDLIRRYIRTLWLFVPGHSSRHQVIPWQTTPLDIKDLSRVKLIGLCNQSTTGTNWPGPHLRKYISYWDCTSGKLYTPPYNGELLKPILMRTKDRKNEEVFLTHIHCVLSDMAMRAYTYYHSYCASPSKMYRQLSISEAAPKKFHTVKDPPRKTRIQFMHQQLGVKGSDQDIIEYLVELIREQQLLEWRTESAQVGSPQTKEPVTMKLHTRFCVENYCKPKRPY